MSGPTIADLLTQWEHAPLPTLRRRNVRLPRVPRKAIAVVGMRRADVTGLTGRIARTNTMTDRQGQAALHLAADLGRARVAKYLLEHGARTDLTDDAGQTPLALAQAQAKGADGQLAARREEIAALLRAAAR
jgi:hypothetical protein